MRKVLYFALSLAACQKTPSLEPAVALEVPADQHPAVAAQPNLDAMTDAGGPISDADIARAPTDGPLVEVTDPGQAPLQLLRLTPTLGDLSQVRFDVDFTVNMTMDGVEMPAPKIPTMGILMSMEITGLEEGQIAYETEITAIEIGEDDPMFPGMGAEMEASMAAMIGLRGVGAMTDTGHMLSMEFIPPEGATADQEAQIDNLERTFGHLSAPLPEEPVGVGATWITLSRTEQDMVSLVQRSTTRLTALDGEQLSTATSLIRVWDGDEIDASDLPPGSQIEVLRFSGTGEGTSTLALDTLAPLQSEIFTVVDLTLKMSTGALPSSEMSQKITETSRIARE